MTSHPSPSFCRGIIAIFVLLSGAAPLAVAQPQIPVLTWTQRSDWLNVKRPPFNAHGDGVNDDTAAIQAALTESGTSYQYRTVYLPAGTYKISNTLNWQGTTTPWTYGCTGVTLVGCGANTTIIWSGSSGLPMFWTKGATRSRYIGIAWNGENTASCAYEASSAFLYEGRIRHENESFSNFVVSGTYVAGETLPAAGIIAGLSIENNSPDAEVMIFNCLFSNCTNGVIVGYEEYNNYQWEIKQCEFDGCGNGILWNDGKGVVLDNHFSGSTVADVTMGAGSSQTVRRCTSQGSNTFLVVQGGGSASTQLIQDCWVDSWKSTYGAIQLSSRGPANICDVNFTNPPNSNAPIQWGNSPSCPAEMLVSDIYCPTLTNLVSIFGGGTVTTGTVPLGCRLGDITSLSSPSVIFLQSAAQIDSTNIIDVTLPPYNAVNNGSTDVTTVVQSAINAAKAANNGSIVYLPSPATKYGGYYVTSTLVAGGSNYTIQGSGLASDIVWGGAASGTVAVVMTMPNPQNVELQQFVIRSATTATSVIETATGANSVIYDGLYCYSINGYNPDGPGLLLSQLPAASQVYMEHLDSALTVEDCGPAHILGNFVLGGRLIVNGPNNPKTGVFGILNFEGGTSFNDPAHWNVEADDNQNITIGHYYEEQGYNHLQANRGAGTTPGHVTFEEVKQNFELESDSNTCISINNYAGRVVLNTTNFANAFGIPVTQTGTNAVNLILVADELGGAAPVTNITAACNLIETQDIYAVSGTLTYPSPIMPAEGGAAIAAGDDDQRQLGEADLSYHYGILDAIANPSVEADAANPSPTTVLGYAPSLWSVSGSTTAGSGVRNVTVVSGTASPFGTGTQSILFIDTTSTSTGSNLQLSQQTTALQPGEGAVFTFDFRLNPLTSLNDDVWVNVYCNGNASSAFAIHLTGSGTNGAISASASGLSETLATLSLSTWYRVRGVIQAPNSSASAQVHLYLYQWSGSGYSAVTLYNNGWIDGLESPATSGGLDQVQFNLGSPGENTSINFDNLTLMAGDPALNTAGQPAPPPIITSTLSVTGTSGYPFTYQITAGTTPTSYAATELPQLPPGLGIDPSSGLISGTPTATGTFAITISAINAGGTNSKTLSLSILAPPLVITSGLTLTGTYGVPLSYQITATNNPISFNATGLPAGMSLDPLSGLISGTPAASGTFAVGLSAVGLSGTSQVVPLALSVDVIFGSVKGTYKGVVAVGGSAQGLFTLALSSKGGFTGKLTLADAQYSFRNAFTIDGLMTYTVKVGATLLQMSLGFEPGPAVSGTIVATTAGVSTQYNVGGNLLGVYKPATLPSGIAGRYTVVLPAVSGSDPKLPQGPGYGTMTVSSRGAIRVTGKLGDGTAFSAGSQLDADGKTWMLFKPLYGGRTPGWIDGMMTFENIAGSDCNGMIGWSKPPRATARYYPGGFAVAAPLVAAKYVGPPLATGTASITIGGGDLPQGAVSEALMISTTPNKVAASGSNSGSVSVALVPGTGMFRGGFLYPAMNGTRKIPFGGVIFQKPAPVGFGQLLGTDQSGCVEITQ